MVLCAWSSGKGSWQQRIKLVVSIPSQCAENIMTVFDLLMALFMGTEDNGEYVQNVIYSGRVLIVQKQIFSWEQMGE